METQKDLVKTLLNIQEKVSSQNLKYCCCQQNEQNEQRATITTESTRSANTLSLQPTLSHAKQDRSITISRPKLQKNSLITTTKSNTAITNVLIYRKSQSNSK